MVIPCKCLESRRPLPNGVSANVRVGRPVQGSGEHECSPHVAPIERGLCWTDNKKPLRWRFVRLVSGLLNPYR